MEKDRHYFLLSLLLVPSKPDQRKWRTKKCPFLAMTQIESLKIQKSIYPANGTQGQMTSDKNRLQTKNHSEEIIIVITC